jgi:putative transposase
LGLAGVVSITELNAFHRLNYMLCKALDRLLFEDSKRGTRRMCDELRKMGIRIGRVHTRTLMQRMRIKTIYFGPRTTCIYITLCNPYLLRNVKIELPNQV